MLGFEQNCSIREMEHGPKEKKNLWNNNKTLLLLIKFYLCLNISFLKKNFTCIINLRAITEGIGISSLKVILKEWKWKSLDETLIFILGWFSWQT